MEWTQQQRVRRLLDQYQDYFKGKVSYGVIEALSNRLKGIALQNLEEALDKCAHASQFFPSYSEIIAALPRTTDLDEQDERRKFEAHKAEVLQESAQARRIYDYAVKKFGEERVLKFINEYIENLFGFNRCKQFHFDASLFSKCAMLDLERYNYDFGRALGSGNQTGIEGTN